MKRRAARLLVTALLAGAVSTIDVHGLSGQPADRRGGSPRASRPRTPTVKRPARPSLSLPCGDYIGFQVLLDRQGFSPGQIDGRPGSNFAHALAAFQSARALGSSGQPDCDAWRALDGQSAEPTVTTYRVTAEDMAGPFDARIPPSLTEQARLRSLNYRSPLEALAERFHASPALLSELNANAPIAAGRDIRVPAVTPFNPDLKPAAEPSAGDVTIEVTTADSSLRAIGADGAVLLFLPVTTGSEHDPLPTGDYKVTGVRWLPPFHYNPDLFWDAESTDEKAIVPPGPNNPVGVAWIALSLDHYGLHGTPEPGNVGHTASHGCVRMTNWDAARVAALVKPGTPVRFR